MSACLHLPLSILLYVAHGSLRFLQPLGMKKSEAEKSLHEVVKGCNLKKGSQCQVVQVFVRLLSVVLYGTDEE